MCETVSVPIDTTYAFQSRCAQQTVLTRTHEWKRHKQRPNQSNHTKQALYIYRQISINNHPCINQPPKPCQPV
ncbi:hypothetical protein Hanom_Chr02g00131971 [Helianthus anomalus]